LNGVQLLIFIFICSFRLFALISLALFGSSQSASFECNYLTSDWNFIGPIYYCDVQNAVNITSLDAAQVDDISGAHWTGYNNGNVEGFHVYERGQIHYFPRGLNEFFKNIKGIYIGKTGLKELHQSDLKHFPKLITLASLSSDLEILEENLFEFNPNLDYIDLGINKITHIDPNVFDKLTKLNTLYLWSNTCINMFALKNQTEVQNVIKTAKAQCINSDYSNMEQKVKNLEIESKNLNSENFKIEIENLENLIKNSKFPNFFQENLKYLKSALIEKKKLEFFNIISAITKNSSFEMCSALESKFNNVKKNVKDLAAITSIQTDYTKAEFAALRDNLAVFKTAIFKMEQKISNISDAITVIYKNYEKDQNRFSNLMKALEKIFL